jgi:hypothetical protein
MYVKKVIKGFLGDLLSSLHAKLAEAVSAAVGGVLSGGHLSLSQLARSVKLVVAVRYRVKRIDRLLGNTSLHDARLEIYRKLATSWLTGLTNVLVLIDWSDATTDQRWHLLRASVAVEGRSVTLYEEIHPQSAYGNLEVHRRFLACLAELLPVACQPMIITDAGFRSTWFDLVSDRHWPWIGRLRGKDMVSIARGPWRRCTAVFLDATARNQVFPDAQYVRSHPTPCQLILSSRTSKGRHRRTRMGKPSRSRSSLKAARSAREPWLLACSPGLNVLNAAAIIAIYAKRMQIEQSFRDLKNERLGLGFSAARSHSAKRLEVLLLIAHLSSWMMRLIGECAQKCHMECYFQSVPGLKHREISVITLARRVINAGAEWLNRLRPQDAIPLLRQQAQAACHGA